MATYNPSKETSELIQRYAAIRQLPPDQALQELLWREVRDSIRPVTAQEPLERMRQFHQQYPPNPAALPNTKATYDALYGFLE